MPSVAKTAYPDLSMRQLGCHRPRRSTCAPVVRGRQRERCGAVRAVGRERAQQRGAQRGALARVRARADLVQQRQRGAVRLAPQRLARANARARVRRTGYTM